MKKDIVKIILLVIILAALVVSIVYMKKKDSSGIDMDDWEQIMSSDEYGDDESEDIYGIEDVEGEALGVDESSDESTVFDTEDAVADNTANASNTEMKTVEE